jgi:hypothetical protein
VSYSKSVSVDLNSNSESSLTLMSEDLKDIHISFRDRDLFSKIGNGLKSNLEILNTELKCVGSIIIQCSSKD